MLVHEIQIIIERELLKSDERFVTFERENLKERIRKIANEVSNKKLTGAHKKEVRGS